MDISLLENLPETATFTSVNSEEGRKQVHNVTQALAIALMLRGATGNQTTLLNNRLFTLGLAGLPEVWHERTETFWLASLHQVVQAYKTLYQNGQV